MSDKKPKEKGSAYCYSIISIYPHAGIGGIIFRCVLWESAPLASIKEAENRPTVEVEIIIVVMTQIKVESHNSPIAETSHFVINSLWLGLVNSSVVPIGKS